MSSAPSPYGAPPPGWYPDPQGYGQRYWDGVNWTQNVAPHAVTGDPATEAKTGDWIGGVLISLLFPPLGLVAGIVYAALGGTRRTVGFMCIAISVTVILLYIALTGSR